MSKGRPQPSIRPAIRAIRARAAAQKLGLAKNGMGEGGTTGLHTGQLLRSPTLQTSQVGRFRSLRRHFRASQKHPNPSPRARAAPIAGPCQDTTTPNSTWRPYATIRRATPHCNPTQTKWAMARRPMPTLEPTHQPPNSPKPRFSPQPKACVGVWGPSV
jgi:hypothetical protein